MFRLLPQYCCIVRSDHEHGLGGKFDSSTLAVVRPNGATVLWQQSKDVDFSTRRDTTVVLQLDCWSQVIHGRDTVDDKEQEERQSNRPWPVPTCPTQI
eukprot:scaffold69310_cov48-Attheya_sp.AAC.9